MDYQTAVLHKEMNQHLIGQPYKGSTIDEIIIFPTDQGAFKNFIDLYSKDEAADKCLQPFKHLDLQVAFVVNKRKYRQTGILFYTSLEKLKQEGFSVITIAT
ncbi:hypothetical protein Q0590_36835 [Rhodocytophaga aerolata]|uniref:Uncharacterized protein n=1 Tax=Rhodocytophaga aerolata TaxID=455078 RepID=A0ABT8RIT7_9BACT|nr:hypothetical protein [Rhodocytophaga aerolata]MDO1451894.1 hypothetical protein [Rhodocytophaga aerolata]